MPSRNSEVTRFPERSGRCCVDFFYEVVIIDFWRCFGGVFRWLDRILRNR